MRKKQRGLRRKIANFKRHISEETSVFPKPHLGSDYWHLHLPVAGELVDSANISRLTQRLFIQILVDQTQHLVNIAPVGEGSIKVVAAICLPRIWDSQIIVFFGPDYLDGFFKRDSATQKWTEIEAKRSFSREWGIQIPFGFSERGYYEEIVEPDFQYKGEIWFLGQIDLSK